MTEIAQRIVATHERHEKEPERVAPPHHLDPSVVSGLRTQLSEAQQREAAAVKALEDFKNQVVEVGGQAAEDNDWCGEYENIMARLGLTAAQNHEVEYEITFRTKATVFARSPALAINRIEGAGVDIGIEPDDSEDVTYSHPFNVTRRVITTS